MHTHEKLILGLLCVILLGVVYWTYSSPPNVPALRQGMFPTAHDFNRVAALLDCPVKAQSGALINPSISALLDCLEERKMRTLLGASWRMVSPPPTVPVLKEK